MIFDIYFIIVCFNLFFPFLILYQFFILYFTFLILYFNYLISFFICFLFIFLFIFQLIFNIHIHILSCLRTNIPHEITFSPKTRLTLPVALPFVVTRPQRPQLCPSQRACLWLGLSQPRRCQGTQGDGKRISKKNAKLRSLRLFRTVSNCFRQFKTVSDCLRLRKIA